MAYKPGLFFGPDLYTRSTHIVLVFSDTVVRTPILLWHMWHCIASMVLYGACIQGTMVRVVYRHYGTGSARYCSTDARYCSTDARYCSTDTYTAMAHVALYSQYGTVQGMYTAY